MQAPFAKGKIPLDGLMPDKGYLPLNPISKAAAETFLTREQVEDETESVKLLHDIVSNTLVRGSAEDENFRRAAGDIYFFGILSEYCDDSRKALGAFYKVNILPFVAYYIVYQEQGARAIVSMYDKYADIFDGFVANGKTCAYAAVTKQIPVRMLETYMKACVILEYIFQKPEDIQTGISDCAFARKKLDAGYKFARLESGMVCTSLDGKYERDEELTENLFLKIKQILHKSFKADKKELDKSRIWEKLHLAGGLAAQSLFYEFDTDYFRSNAHFCNVVLQFQMPMLFLRELLNREPPFYNQDSLELVKSCYKGVKLEYDEVDGVQLLFAAKGVSTNAFMAGNELTASDFKIIAQTMLEGEPEEVSDEVRKERAISGIIYTFLLNEIETIRDELEGRNSKKEKQKLLAKEEKIRKKQEELDRQVSEYRQKQAEMEKTIEKLNAEIRSREDIIAQKDKSCRLLQAELEQTESDREEVVALRDFVYKSAAETPVETSQSVDEIASSLKDLSVVIVGGHTNFINKMKQSFPDWTYYDAGATSISPAIIKNADIVLFFDSFLSHKLYYSAIDICRSQRIPFGYLGTGVNVEKQMRNICDICRNAGLIS